MCIELWVSFRIYKTAPSFTWIYLENDTDLVYILARFVQNLGCRWNAFLESHMSQDLLRNPRIYGCPCYIRDQLYSFFPRTRDQLLLELPFEAHLYCLSYKPALVLWQGGNLLLQRHQREYMETQFLRQDLLWQLQRRSHRRERKDLKIALCDLVLIMILWG